MTTSQSPSPHESPPLQPPPPHLASPWAPRRVLPEPLDDFDLAMALLFQFIGYLRPGELCSLRGDQLIEPVHGAGTACWSS